MSSQEVSVIDSRLRFSDLQRNTVGFFSLKMLKNHDVAILYNGSNINLDTFFFFLDLFAYDFYLPLVY